MVNVYSLVRVPALLLWGGDLISDLDGFFSDNLDTFVSMALMVAGIITAVYAGFGLRKYLAGEGRSETELLKVIIGFVVFLVLLAGGLLAFFGKSTAVAS